MPNFRAVVDEPIPAKYIRTALSLTSKLNLVIVTPLSFSNLILQTASNLILQTAINKNPNSGEC